MLHLLLAASVSSLPTACLSTQSADPWIELARAHYAAVEDELLTADLAALSTAQRAARIERIEALRAYRLRGEFGRQAFESGARLPQFVDIEGRRCAVAELLHASGEPELVSAVAQTDNQAWILDFAHDATFQAWLEESGLTLWEATRIQLPSTGASGNAPSDTRPFTGRRGNPGPGDTLGPGARGSSGATPTPAAPGSPSQPAAPPTSPQTRDPRAAITEDDTVWWLWWEYNKLRWLPTRDLALRSAPATGELPRAERERMIEEQLERMRSSLGSALERALDAAEAEVRAEAVVALGRTRRASAIASILPLLDDPNYGVRHRALLALGATGASEAQVILESFARGERAADVQAKTISPFARAFAVVGLGVGRRLGFDARADGLVATLMRGRNEIEAGREDLVLATLLYATLIQNDELAGLALEIALDEGEAVDVRGRAIESLGSTGDERTISRLQHLLSGANLELRRSAALALGRIRHPLVLPPLMTAFETEREPLVRAFLLISIGEQGGARAREFLGKVLASDERALRPWCALALGRALREQNEPRLALALRESAKRVGNADDQGAYWIALGLARDAEALPAIVDGLTKAADPRQRMYAATALALLGVGEGREALLGRLPLENDPLARVAIAQGLGQFGVGADAAHLIEVLRTLREPALRGLAAVALGFHGSSEALSGLLKLSEVTQLPAATRAATWNALGMVLSTRKPLGLSDASQASNYAQFEPWVEELLQCSL